MSIAPSQRFTRRTQDCPICGGNGDDPRHRSERCYGFLSADERWGICTREEYSGQLAPTERGDYLHALDGACGCGEVHGNGHPRPPAVPKALPAPPQWHTEPFPTTLAGADLTAQYPYEDAGGHRLYTVLRYTYPLAPGQTKREKTFRQVRHRDGDPSVWAWGLGIVERTLYHQREVRAALHFRPIFIVEGEKAAEALIAIGLMATTCSEGAHKWGQVPSRHEALHKRHCVLLGDNDSAGKTHAQAVAADLDGIAASVLIVELPGLPDHGDVVEWLAAGGTAAELLERTCATALLTTGDHVHQETQETSEGDEDGEPDPRAPRTITEQHNRTLERQDAWERKLLSNPNLSAPYKAAATLVYDDWVQHCRAKNPDGFLPVSRTSYARRLGTSTRSVSNVLQGLEVAGAITRHVDRTYDADGLPRSHLSIRPTEALLRMPEAIEPPRPRNGWGGGRQRFCPSCGSARLILRTAVVCQDCGAVEHVQDRPLNTEQNAEEEQEREEAATTAPAQERCPGAQDDTWKEETGDRGGTLSYSTRCADTPMGTEPTSLPLSEKGEGFGLWDMPSYRKDDDVERWKRVHDGG